MPAEQREWHVTDGSNMSGPHTMQELAAAFASGRIPRSASVRHTSWDTWAPAGDHFEEARDPLDQLAGGAPAVSALAHAPRPSGPRVPPYRGIAAGASVLYCFALANVFVALLFVAAAVDHWSNSGGERRWSLADQPDGILWLGAGGSATSAALLWLLGSVAMAIRDIAQNSYR